jgi:hypothetical protein
MFWRQRPVRELAIIGEHLAPTGRLFLFHEPPPGNAMPPIPGTLPELLEEVASLSRKSSSRISGAPASGASSAKGMSGQLEE